MTHQFSDHAGAFTISLDLELFWGVQNRYSNPDGYRDHILGVHQAVPRMLAAFREYDIRATWAVVGLLYANSVDEARTFFPRQLPEIDGSSCYRYFARTDVKAGDPCYFAPDLIRQIRETPGQEIACHGFAHLPYTSRGLTIDDVRNDIRAALNISRTFGDHPQSFVFPRNSFQAEHVRALSEFDFTSFRDFPRGDGANRWWRRLWRLADSHWDLGGDQMASTDRFDRGTADGALIEFPATRFLRPATGSWVDVVRLRRIATGMQRAARERRIYHLWWHPHNFGANVDLNMRQLTRIMDHFAELRAKDGMQSLSMSDLASMTTSCKPT